MKSFMLLKFQQISGARSRAFEGEYFTAGVYTLWSRELTRFFRQPSRVAGAMGSPLIFWLLIGSGIGKSFNSSSGGYLAYFFPGTILMIVFFTAVFSTISIIEDRREGFLQAVLVAPIPRSAMVLGKVSGGATLAFIQAMLFLIFAPLVGIHLTFSALLLTGVVIFVNAFFMTAMGFLMAWRFNSIQGFHAMMNLLLMPMWMMSGAVFPAEGASVWVRMLMKINPLSYGYQALRYSLLKQSSVSFPVSAGAMLVLAALFFASAVRAVSQPSLKNAV